MSSRSPDETFCKASPAEAAAARLQEVRPHLETVQRSLRAISGKWKWEILCLLIDGPRRFNELRRAIAGITQHMLAAQLKDMEAAGLIARHAYREMPPRVEYELTEAARALRPVAEALINWGERHGARPDGGRTHPVEPEELRAAG